MQKIIQKTVNTIKDLELGSILQILIFPTAKAKTFLFSTANSLSDVFSEGRAKIPGVVFHSYFSQIKGAKEIKQSKEIHLSFEEIGSITSLSNQLYKMTFFFLFLNYLVIGVIFATTLSYFAFKLQSTMLISLSGIVSFYYTIVAIYSLYKMKKTANTQIEAIKLYLVNNYPYILAKARELDEEVADITMTVIKESLLIENEKSIEINKAKEDIKKGVQL